MRTEIITWFSGLSLRKAPHCTAFQIFLTYIFFDREITPENKQMRRNKKKRQAQENSDEEEENVLHLRLDLISWRRTCSLLPEGKSEITFDRRWWKTLMRWCIIQNKIIKPTPILKQDEKSPKKNKLHFLTRVL